MATSKFGSVEKLPSGRYRARHNNPKKKNQRIYAHTTFTTKTAARAWLAKQQAEIEAGTWVSPDEKEAQAKKDGYTFGEYTKKWLELKQTQLSYTTLKAYKSHLKTHLLPKWGDTPLKQITRTDVSFWLVNDFDITRPGRKSIYDTFRAILNCALDAELIDKNPCGKDMLKVSKDVKKQSQRSAPRPLTREELLALAHEYGTTSPHMRAFVLLVGFLGLRLGEARELRLKDIDFDKGLVHVSRSCPDVTVKGERVITSPKTVKSVRVVPLPSFLAEELKAHMSLYSGSGQGGLVFPSQEDKTRHLGASTIRVGIRRAGQRAGIDGRVNVHDLRHTAASLMSHAPGCTQEEAKALLGHETSTITQRYVHHEASRLRTALESHSEGIQEYLGG